MNIELLEFNQWVDRWLKADFDMSPGLNGGNADPDYYIFRYFTTDGNLNFVTSYQNQQVSDAIKQARTTTDTARRKQLYDQVQRTLVDEAPFVWLWVGRDYVGLSRARRRASSTSRPGTSRTCARPGSTSRRRPGTRGRPDP